ncbi:MAG TPA: helix-turn-helix domain-containing protein [Candidatus Bathyarchaeia archaeon]|nr:helix-turn-helix domain-containing protein [Candidatus Bathyarchaeia archaeon]
MSINIDKNKNSEIRANLKSLGLGEKETIVYVALLALGETGSSKIIKNTGLHGQFVYTALESLEQKSLVQYIEKRGRKKFSAKNPKMLVQLIDQQKRIAEEVADKLNEMILIPTRNEFEIFQGKESYVAHEFDLMNQAPEKCELLIIGGMGDKFSENMGDEIRAYEKMRRAKKITVRYLGSADQKEYLEKNKKSRQFFDYRVLPGLFTGMVNTNIWPGAIGFNIFGEPVTNFTISSAVIAGSYKQFFETLWKLASR